MSRILLMVMAVVAALVVTGALVWQNFFAGEKAGASGPPRIAIVTDSMLLAQAQAQSRERSEGRLVEGAWAAAQQQAPPAAAKGKAKTEPKAEEAASDPSEAPVPPSQAGGDAQLMADLLADQMEAQINKVLTNSNRFAVMDVSSVQATVIEMSQVRAAKQLVTEEKQASAIEAVAENTKKMVTAKAEQSTTTTAPPSIATNDYANAADKLKARYLLHVSLKDPQWTSELAFVDDSRGVWRIEADPVFVYRLFDVRQNRTVLSDATQLDQPVVVEVPYAYSALEKLNFKTNAQRALREMSTNLQARVARHIADHVLDATFPARIRSASPLTVSRGANDGVSIGDQVEIYRIDASKAVRDVGKDGQEIVIDAPETLVGSARVTAVQANTATLEPIGAAVIQVDDVVRRTGGGVSTQSQASAVSGRGLGKGDILANQANAAAGGALIRERIAVGNLKVTRDDNRIDASALAMDRALGERLAREPRIEVMSREAMGQLRDEQAVGGARRSYERGAGISGAGYLVLGDVTVNVQRTASTIDVPGAEKREISASYALIANGSLRIERTDSRIMDSFDVSARAPLVGAAGDAESARRISAAFADAAARAILPRLFPIEVAQANGASVVLNRGADIGLKPGDTLTLYTIGPPVIDPTTKAQISNGMRTRAGEVVINDVQDTLSTASLKGAFSVAVGQVAERGGAPAPKVAAKAGAKPATAKKAPAEGSVPW